ncbi:MAG TPA: transcription elongation factor GreA [Actinomycetota bacterium]|nr:transcription elongation factor GreA [Actinomycetota bacterium]
MPDEPVLPTKAPRQSGQEPTARLTKDAYMRMKAELDRLKSEGRQTMSERLLRAREHGDIRENAEYDTAKNEQGLMEARIRDLERQLRDPEIIEAGGGDEVAAGTLVTLRLVEDTDDSEDETYLMALSPEERAPGVRTITPNSPLGSVLLGRRVGDRVTYEAPGGTFAYEVISITAHPAG